MSLFDRSFIITTGITAVICGAIFYYFNTRMKELELALVRQSQVLSSFISNVQQEFRSGAGANVGGRANELASPEAIKAVSEEHKKIVISDSECASEDSDSDDDSVSDNDSDNDSDNYDGRANIKVDDSPLDDTNNKLVICDLPSIADTNNNDNNDIKLIDISAVENLLLSDDNDESDDDSADDSDNEFEHVKDNIKIETVNIKVEKLDSIDVEEVSVDVDVDIEEFNVNATEIKPKVNYSELKVDELRKIVMDKGLAKKEEAKKLKKNELLTLLSTK